MDAIEWILEKIGDTAEWRSGKAEEFPDDSRNLEAVEELENLAKEVTALRASQTAQNIEALDGLTEKLGMHPHWLEWLNEELGGIGFRTGYSSGAKFLEAVLEKLEHDLRIEHNDEVIAILGPSKDDLIDADETVKAADQVLDGAREAFKTAEKAYQEARIRARARLAERSSASA
jgi:hypothetical protein